MDSQQKNKSKLTQSPLQEADKIVNKRTEERDREYGGFTESMAKTARIATELCGKEILTSDAFMVLIALKLSRVSHSPKFDSFVDLIGYAEGLWNYIQEGKQSVYESIQSMNAEENKWAYYDAIAKKREEEEENKKAEWELKIKKEEEAKKVYESIQFLCERGYTIKVPAVVVDPHFQSMDWKDQCPKPDRI